MNIMAHFETVIADKIRDAINSRRDAGTQGFDFETVGVFRFHVADAGAVDKTTMRHIEVNAKPPTTTRFPIPKYTCEITVYAFIPNEEDGAVNELGALSALVSDVVESFVYDESPLNAENDLKVTKVEVSSTGNDVDLEIAGRVESYVATVNFLRLDNSAVNGGGATG